MSWPPSICMCVPPKRPESLGHESRKGSSRRTGSGTLARRNRALLLLLWRVCVCVEMLFVCAGTDMWVFLPNDVKTYVCVRIVRSNCLCRCERVCMVLMLCSQFGRSCYILCLRSSLPASVHSMRMAAFELKRAGIWHRSPLKLLFEEAHLPHPLFLGAMLASPPYSYSSNFTALSFCRPVALSGLTCMFHLAWTACAQAHKRKHAQQTFSRYSKTCKRLHFSFLSPLDGFHLKPLCTQAAHANRMLLLP